MTPISVNPGGSGAPVSAVAARRANVAVWLSLALDVKIAQKRLHWGMAECNLVSSGALPSTEISSIPSVVLLVAPYTRSSFPSPITGPHQTN